MTDSLVPVHGPTPVVELVRRAHLAVQEALAVLGLGTHAGSGSGNNDSDRDSDDVGAGDSVGGGLVVQFGAAAGAALQEVPEALEGLTRVTEALRAAVLPIVEQEGLWALDGQRSFISWLMARTCTTRARADRDVRRAHMLRDHLPQARAALAAGQIGTDQVDTLVRHGATSPARVQALADTELGEGFLVDAARETSAAGFRQVVRTWAAAVDPDAEDRAWREQCARQFLTLAPTMGGWHLQGWLEQEAGQALRAALDAATGRPATDDGRTRAQRDADALHSLARHSLDTGATGSSARLRPHLLIHVPHQTLEAHAHASADAAAASGALSAGDLTAGARGAGRPAAGGAIDAPPAGLIPADPEPEVLTGLEPATFADGTPLAPGQLGRHLCHASLTRIVLDGAGHPIDVGRSRRLFTPAQAKAVYARDRHCQYPGCHAPPGWGEIHHALPWTQGGTTDIANAILLCWTHHHAVHQHRLTIHAHPDRWEILRHDGTLHSTAPRGRPGVGLRRRE